jgi:single-strand DNA-binding protein
MERAKSMSEVTITGNLATDVELKYTPTGTPVCTFRLARQERYRNPEGQWTDGETLFIAVTAWRDLANNVAESLTKGMRVVVQGKIRSHSFEDTKYKDTEGNSIQRYVTEILADDISLSLRMATAKATKATRTPSKDEETEAPF